MNAQKLTQKSLEALQEAQSIASRNSNQAVDQQHLMLALLSQENGLVPQLFVKMDIAPENIEAALTRAVDDIPKVQVGGRAQDSVYISSDLDKAFAEAESEASRMKDEYVSVEHLVMGIMDSPNSALKEIFKTFGVTKTKFLKVLQAVRGNAQVTSQNPEETYDVLKKYGQDLVELARQNKLDPVIGRDSEIRNVIRILSRKTKNNPCLIGEPGVGKTAVIEGLAQKMVAGDIPESLKETRLVTLDITSMVAGAKYRGEFEERLKKVMNELKNEDKIIVFIDEIHTIVGAGGAEGAIDASNILKPALARGEIKCIGATTIDEYRKYIEKDAALERRFQTINIEEPNKEETLRILYGLRDKYESHHKVKITDEALKKAVELADRYITDRFMPDKAIDLIDESASKVRISKLTLPPELKQKEIDIEKSVTEKEDAIKNQDFEKAANLRDKEKLLKEEFESIKEQWRACTCNAVSVVDEEDIAKVVSIWSRVPLERLNEKEADKLLRLEEVLKNKIIGQDEAIGVICKAIKRARVGLKNPHRPIGTFFFCGPTGVGKTELSNVIAEVMFGSTNSLIRIDMSEYMEKHSVSRLIGPPPGYVGYEEGGQLTEAVRRKPYSVVLLDEIEKAHEDVFNILLQIMDDGRLTDSKGKIVNFKNTIIIMTSNEGAQKLKKQNTMGFFNDVNNNAVQYEKMKEFIMGELKNKFRPEFLNRLDEIVVFNQLNEENIKNIVDIMLSDTINRLKEKEIFLDYDKELNKFIADKNENLSFGARPIRRIITREIEDKLSDEMLKGEIKRGDRLSVCFKDDELIFSHK